MKYACSRGEWVSFDNHNFVPFEGFPVERLELFRAMTF